MIMIEIPVDLKKVDKKSGDREIAEAVITCRNTGSGRYRKRCGRRGYFHYGKYAAEIPGFELYRLLRRCCGSRIYGSGESSRC